MPYTPEMFNRYNQRVEDCRNTVCRHIQYILKPDDGYPKKSDIKLKELYDMWRAECRAMDAALEETVHLVARREMIEMPAEDEEHTLCRRMAAVIIERNIFGEQNAQYYLPPLIEKMKTSNCWKHPYTCACHILTDWTYANQELVSSLSAYYLEKKQEQERTARLARLAEPAGGGPVNHQPAMGDGPPVYRSALRVGCAGWRDCTCGGCSGGGMGAQRMPSPPPLRRTTEHIGNCACGSCYNKRVADGTQDAYMASLRAETDRVLAGKS